MSASVIAIAPIVSCGNLSCSSRFVSSRNATSAIEAVNQGKRRTRSRPIRTTSRTRSAAKVSVHKTETAVK